MPLNATAQKAKSHLSSAAQNRIDKLLDKGESTVHHSNLNTILTKESWKELAKRTLSLSSVFEISTIEDLNKLLTTPRFWQLTDHSGFIRALFRTHYFDILKSEKQTGDIVSSNDKIYKKVKKQNETTRKGNKDDGWTTIAPTHPVPDSNPACFSPGYYDESAGHGESNADKAIIEESEQALKYADLLKNVYNIIFHGAPGTGKTFLALKVAEKMGCDENQIKMVQFHPSYDYSDFMEGLRPTHKNGEKEISFERMNGAFKEFCRKALKENNDKEEKISLPVEFENQKSDHSKAKPYVFIIDEINRGEIAKIMGECMFSIDPGYVGNKHKIETQYQNLIDKNDREDPFNHGFYRPENVYIIGTMNDIDRGVESMDLAMRRRFLFIEIKAEDTQEEILNNMDEGADKEIAKRAMNNLNKKIREIEELGEDYCIGASYFLKVKNYDLERKWTLLWEYHLNGLLKEYLRGMENNKNILHDLRKVYFNSVDKPSENPSEYIESDKNITPEEEFSDNNL